MAEETELIKNLFSNYLRNLYIELSPEELAWVKERQLKISSSQWSAIVPSINLTKGILSYYLISQRCPEYLYKTSVDLIEDRFDDEKKIKEIVDFNGIVILRHSATFIRNKLMFETLMYIVAERCYKRKSIIVVSDVVKDKGEYIYYDHDALAKYISCDVSAGLFAKTSMHSAVSTSSIPHPHANSSRPLANIVKSEQQLKSRSKSIEEGAKNAI